MEALPQGESPALCRPLILLTFALWQWIFRERMADQFMLVLLQTLLVRSHQLLQEEIGLTLYNMAAVNFDHFYAHFLPHFLQSCESLDSSQKAALAANFPADKVTLNGLFLFFC